jgi:hypothetical protein
MPNAGGFGRGFGFRGYSPSWPYIGRGRGGLPRCWSNASNDYNEGWYPYPGNPQFAGNPTFGPAVAPAQELAFLKNQAEMLRQQLEYIVARVEDLEKAGKES